MVRSRLTRKIEEKTKKNLFFSVLGIIFITFIIFKFGIPLLVNLSVFLSGSKDNQVQPKNQDPSFITVPILDPLPKATNSASILISGTASKNQTINLYINNELIDKTNTKEDGSFLFRETIATGENEIKVKAVVQEKESEFSNILTTAFKNAAPSLNIVSPADGQSFTKDQNFTDIKGTTDTDVKITVNGFWAITDDKGNFSYRFPLEGGENKIKVIAADIAGNKTEKEITVILSQ